MLLFHISDIRMKLLAMKETNGKSLKAFCDGYDKDGLYKTIQIVMCPSDKQHFTSLRCQFFQSLHDNISQRFPDTNLLKASSILNKETWPVDPLERALFGESEVGSLCKQFNIPSLQAAKIVMEFSLYKHHGKFNGTKFGKFYADNEGTANIISSM